MTKTATEGLANTALLVWRGITFIFPILISGFVTAFYHASPKQEAEMSVPDRDTFVELQNQTYVERSQDLETLLETNKLSREAIMKKLKGENKKPRQKRERRVEVSPGHRTDYDNIEINDEDE